MLWYKMMTTDIYIGVIIIVIIITIIITAAYQNIVGMAPFHSLKIHSERLQSF